jgi:hypothetical protein
MANKFDIQPSFANNKARVSTQAFAGEKIKLRKGLDFAHQNLPKSKHKKYFLGNKFIMLATFFLIILSSGVIYIWQKGAAEKMKGSIMDSRQKEFESAENVWDLQKTERAVAENSASVSEKMLVISSENNKVYVILKTQYGSDQQSLFEFEKDDTVDSAGVGTESLAVLSPDKEKVAYVSREGLFLYDLKKNEKISLIKKEKEAMVNLGVPPIWSIGGLEKVYSLGNPKWSKDGKFLSFIQLYPNNYGFGIIDINNREFKKVERDGGRQVSGLNAQWSGTGSLLVNPEFSGENNSGLFVSSAENFSILENLGEKMGKKEVDFYEAALSGDNKKVVFIYKEDYENEDDNILGVVDMDGGSFMILDEKEFKTLPFFSPKGDVVYFMNELADNSMLLSSINLETKKRNDLVIMPKDFNYWISPEWKDEKYLSLIGNSFDPLDKKQKNKEKFLLIDIENKKIINEAEIDENMDFLGFVNSLKDGA